MAPALNARMFGVAAAAPTLGAATTPTAAFNIVNTCGPRLGGVVSNAGLGCAATAGTGAAMAMATLSLRLHQHVSA
ncbi:hypothetical protein OHA89_38530 [Streptomyces sp. NBC_01546]